MLERVGGVVYTLEHEQTWDGGCVCVRELLQLSASVESNVRI